MNFYLKKYANKKHSLWICAVCLSFLLSGCGNSNTAGSQARQDLTAEHVRGLYSGMKRNEIEDLLGGSDKSLAEKESIEVYSLADGTTALLRYREDTLMGAYLRDKNNVETALFGYGNTNLPGVNGINETENSLNTDSMNNSNVNSTTLESDSIIDNTPMESSTLETSETMLPMESE